MLKLRPSTLFTVLCWAIGALAVGLLVLVGAMVYTHLLNDTVVAVEAPPEGHGGAGARILDPAAAARRFQGAFWPAKSPDQAQNIRAETVDSYGQFIYIGSMVGGPSGDAAIFQKQSDRSQFLAWVGEPVNEIQVMAIAEDSVEAQIAGKPVKLRKVKAVAPAPTRPQGRGGSSRGGNTQQRGNSAASAAISTSSSVTLSSAAGAGAAGGQSQGSSAARGGGSSGDRARPGAVVSRGATSTVVNPSAPGGAAGATSAGRAAGGGDSNSSGGGSEAGRNWRRYWAERLRRQREAASTGTSGGN